MKEPYDVTTPIELFFQIIQDCIDFVSAAQIPLTARQILDFAFLTLQRTGVFNTQRRKWRKKPALEKKWHNFRTFFKEAHTDFREDQDMTAQQASQFKTNAI